MDRDLGGEGPDRSVGRRGLTRPGAFKLLRCGAGPALLMALLLCPADVAGAQDQPDEPCGAALQVTLQSARSLASDGALHQAANLLEGARLACPDHPELLADLIGVRVLQGGLAEAGTLADRLVRTSPEWGYAWELLALTRYLQDDPVGALRAWERVRAPLVQAVDIRLLGQRRSPRWGSGTRSALATGIVPGEPLTAEALVQEERRLRAIPGVERARLGYRMGSPGEAMVEGTAVLANRNPFSRPELLVLGVRLVARQLYVVSADPLGRLERWELSGAMEGSSQTAGIALAHRAPGGKGVWRWELDHHTGRYGTLAQEGEARETRTGLTFTHSDWVQALLRLSVHGQLHARPDHGVFLGGGAGLTLLSHSERAAIGAEATGWTRGGGPEGTPDQATRFGRAELRGSFQAAPPSPGGRRMELQLRGGAVVVSPGIPPDLMPRIGSSGNASLLMRASSDLGDGGVVRSPLPGTAWVHLGVEALHPLGTVGPMALGLAGFVDGVRVVSRSQSPPTQDIRRGAVHLGTGVRAHLPWVDGWLRLDAAVDPSDGSFLLSGGWVREHRLLRLSAH